MNSLEYEFTRILEFNFYVSDEEYEKYESIFLDIIS